MTGPSSDASFNPALVNGLLEFLRQSPTPYHAVANVIKALQAAGFIALDERNAWQLTPGNNYYVTRRDASILAFRYGRQPLHTNGIRIIGSHTDSPCLKVKPRPERLANQYVQLGVEVYGGVLLNPWFDRDLGIAGRLSYKMVDGQLRQALINIARPVAVIPSLAIHLDRTANEQRSVNPQEDMRPILLQAAAGVNFRELLRTELLAQSDDGDIAEVTEYDLSFYDVQPPAVTGFAGDFISSARLDNLLSCYLGLQAMVRSDGEESSLLLLTDHEEVGSQSDIGARSNLLNAFLTRLLGEGDTRYQTMANSLMVSVDNAHGVHPNYARKHDEGHGPLLNSGPVLKVDANQGYATSSETAALLGHWAEQAGVNLQVFVTRADMRCGSTIGPMTAAQSGVRTVDIGLATFAMHSIRELAGSRDPAMMLALLEKFLAANRLNV